jgi:hypothetical protein
MNAAALVLLFLGVVCFFVEAYRARSFGWAALGFVFLAVFVATMGPIRITDD